MNGLFRIQIDGLLGRRRSRGLLASALMPAGRNRQRFAAILI